MPREISLYLKWASCWLCGTTVGGNLPNQILKSQWATSTSCWILRLMMAAPQNQTSQTLLRNHHGKYTTVEHTWPAGQQRRTRYAVILHSSHHYLSPGDLSKWKVIVTFKGYSSYHTYASEINGVVHGCYAILVNSSAPHRQLNLQTCLQAVAIGVTLRKTITVCSIYFLPSMAFNTNEFNDLLSQLPPPVLITGDFNSHSTL